ncbi:alpha-glucosidase-like [Vicia villosa]|uniref:alpha-glucosidase-like n=1 Tax=Vicia villosa TaxID=3911 RepID=UPI00273C26A8|nr:alpha-glucosidase-like [Vicia villosa]
MVTNSGIQTTPLPTLILCFIISIIISHIVADSQVGYGYTITTVTNNPTSNSLTANLKLIKSSSVFGTHIPFLNLTASFETKDILRVRITDSNNQRWEIPQQVIPRDSSSLSHSFLFQNTQNAKHILTHPNSDLIFTLHNTTPFGFTISRKSNKNIIFNTLPQNHNINL